MKIIQGNPQTFRIHQDIQIYTHRRYYQAESKIQIFILNCQQSLNILSLIKISNFFIKLLFFLSFHYFFLELPNKISIIINSICITINSYQLLYLFQNTISSFMSTIKTEPYDFQYLKELAYYQYCLYCQTLDNIKYQISMGLTTKCLPPPPPKRQLPYLKEEMPPKIQIHDGQCKKQQPIEKVAKIQISDHEVQSQVEENYVMPKRYKPMKKSKKLIYQKPERNTLTNLGNQILTYIYLKKKNIDVLKSCFPNLTTDQYYGYYVYAKKIKQIMNGYINYEKLRVIWHKKVEDENQILYQKIIRALSYYYLNSLLVPAVLTSKKMAQNAKPLHLLTRRKLLEILKQNKILALN